MFGIIKRSTLLKQISYFLVVFLFIEVMREGLGYQVRMVSCFIIEDVVESCENVVVLILREQLLLLRILWCCFRWLLIFAYQYLFYVLPYFGVSLVAHKSMINKRLNLFIRCRFKLFVRFGDFVTRKSF